MNPFFGAPAVAGGVNTLLTHREELYCSKARLMKRLEFMAERVICMKTLSEPPALLWPKVLLW